MNEDMKKEYVELQILSQQAEQMNQQLQLIQQQMMELNKLEEGLIQLKKTKKGQKLVLPIGAGVYIESNLEENNEILMNVGAGVVVRKNIDDAKDIVEKQKKELENLFQQAEENFTSINERIMELQSGLTDELN